MAVLNARRDRGAATVVPLCHTPVRRIVIALIVEVTNDTMNTSMTALQPLLHGLRALRGAVGDGGGAVARLVRVDAARDAVAHRHEHPEARPPRRSW